MADNYTQFSFEFATTKEHQAWIDEWVERRLAQDRDEETGYWGCDFTIEHAATSTLIYAEENGNIDQVVELLHAYMIGCSITEPIFFEWAATCSKMRPGEFGGGAVIVTPTETRYLDTRQWCEEQIEAFHLSRNAGCRREGA